MKIEEPKRIIAPYYHVGKYWAEKIFPNDKCIIYTRPEQLRGLNGCEFIVIQGNAFDYPPLLQDDMIDAINTIKHGNTFKYEVSDDN